MKWVTFRVEKRREKVLFLLILWFNFSSDRIGVKRLLIELVKSYRMMCKFIVIELN